MQEKELLRSKKLFLLDLDGTLYFDEILVDGAAEFLQAVRRRGGRSMFLTNNSSKSGEAYVAKMRRLGIETRESDFFTASNAAVHYLRAHGGTERLHYVVGTASFKEQLRAAGFRLSESRDDPVDTLVVGFDTELSFQKIEDACVLLGRGVDYVATNPELTCPTSFGYVPDCGSLCQILGNATGRKPVVVGKPKPDMALMAMREAGASPEETVMIGDRLYIDIACGVNAGVDTVLVLTGESQVADIPASDAKPTCVLRDIKALYEILEGA